MLKNQIKPYFLIRVITMTRLPSLALFAVAASLVTAPAFAADRTNTLFEFEGAIGSQPFRAAAGVPASNTVAGVSPGGAPWPIQSLAAVIKTDGTVRAQVRGVLLGGTDNIGTRGGARQMVLSLFCRNAPVAPAVAGTLQTVSYDSAFVALDENGDFNITSVLKNTSGQTPPANCGDKIDNRPVLLIRTVTPANATTGVPATPSAWFAAGILKRAGYRNFGY
jgi:hypothetical protein